MRQLTRLSFLSEAKNLTFAPCCEIRDSSAAPQNDIATQSLAGERKEGAVLPDRIRRHLNSLPIGIYIRESINFKNIFEFFAEVLDVSKEALGVVLGQEAVQGFFTGAPRQLYFQKRILLFKYLDHIVGVAETP